MKRRGIEAMKFGKTDEKDLLLPPFALSYFDLVCAAACQRPTASRQEFFQSNDLNKHDGQEYLEYCRRTGR